MSHSNNLNSYPAEYFAAFEQALEDKVTTLQLPEEKDARYLLMKLGHFRKILSTSSHPLAPNAYKVAFTRDGKTLKIQPIDESPAANLFRNAIVSVQPAD